MSAESGVPSGIEPIRVLLADDHPVVRRGLAELLASMEGIVVVAEAGNGKEAMREAAIARPDVAIMDLRMPEVDGVQATRELLRRQPSVAVLVLTMFDEDKLVEDAIAAGARGYLLKGAEQEAIERAIRVVAGGDSVFSRDVIDKVLEARHHREPFESLTAREREVLELVARGMSNTVIAHRLSLAPKTVNNHISSVFAKLGVATRAEAIVMGRDAGLGR